MRASCFKPAESGAKVTDALHEVMFVLQVRAVAVKSTAASEVVGIADRPSSEKVKVTADPVPFTLTEPKFWIREGAAAGESFVKIASPKNTLWAIRRNSLVLCNVLRNRFHFPNFWSRQVVAFRPHKFRDGVLLERSVFPWEAILTYQIPGYRRRCLKLGGRGDQASRA